MALTGQHAFITGGSRGIGLACARALLAQGASVTIAGRDAGALERAADGLLAQTLQTGKMVSNPQGQAPGVQAPRVGTCVLDVTDEAAVHAAIAAAAQQLGPITILLNNAGQAQPAPFAKTSSQHWQQMLDVNLTGAFHCTQAALPHMLEQGWGRIVNIASTAGLKGYKYVSAYVAAKHGLVGLTKALALELATRNITVNAVCPGYTETDIVQDAIANIMRKTGRSEEQARAELAAGNPQQKLVQVEEVANAVAWLCQTSSSAMTGQSIAVAGGEVM
ncbi:NAD(P)-dependent dehydrogenase, short-chain alcohol dehydrogenase family [Duganella sp. CF458]|uniref:SDR family NAD(P)-dependent oxidoreductase n=1 Tax=Duganella sp. CF458 TaxID=1884368 RepID=UPI0008E0457B|nr:SDR family NAD(P)-dependent oxidoreductase [Duganella sp. CF458]SFG52126.1 NAD(P)-dependent dehydrogenase, short-chain alcohol dehydrogenase family [Duganella sp. CF458]